MGKTYHQIYIHIVFAVKYRNAIIDSSWQNQLNSVIGNIINENKCKTLIVNGVEDHIHCFFSLRPGILISEVVKNIKAKSSKYINDNNLTSERFQWQVGYGVFSYSFSQIQNVYSYIERQKEHHRTKSLQVEYLHILKKFNVDYNEKDIFDDLQ